uniref:RRM domain-containing protein n=1 Tax=Peronospora matthiolae TaxID=2874970 RepID=A0AAV1V4T3_9STRA
MVRIFRGTHLIKNSNLNERLYVLNLTRIPSNLDDGVIFDYFSNMGLHVLITATNLVGGMVSRGHTHKQRSLNTKPPSLVLRDTARREATRARRAEAELQRALVSEGQSGQTTSSTFLVLDTTVVPTDLSIAPD